MHPIFEQWLFPSTMMEAEGMLLAKGEQAIAELQQFFSGEAKNAYGIAYRELGLPLRCALEVVARLGPIEAPLEPYLVDEFRKGNFVAAQALGKIGKVSPDTIHWLAISLGITPQPGFGVDLPFEAAVALIHLGYAEHPLVLQELASSEKASWVMMRMKKFVRERVKKIELDH